MADAEKSALRTLARLELNDLQPDGGYTYWQTGRHQVSRAVSRPGAANVTPGHTIVTVVRAFCPGRPFYQAT